MPQSLKIKDRAGATRATVAIDDGVVRVTTGAGDGAVLLRGRASDAQGRKYKGAGDETLLRIKPSRSGFRLEDGAGRLLWKVKLRDDGVKLTASEIGEAPLAIRTASARRVEATRERRRVGKVRIYPEQGLVKIKDADDALRFKVRTARLRHAFGVLLFEEIPELERHAVLAELIARGR